MRRYQAIIITLGVGLAIILGAASPARAQEQIQGHGHLAAPQSSGAATLAQPQGQTLTFNVASLNNSGITGLAKLTPLAGDKVELEVVVNGAGAGPQPIHIHEGACADLNPVPEIPLTTVVNGASTSQVDAPLEQLTSMPHAIFLHKSPYELPIFVACADIAVTDRVAAVPSAGEGDSPAGLATGLVGLGCVLAFAGYMLRRRAQRA